MSSPAMHAAHIEYFYASPDQLHGPDVAISGDEFAHLVHVMRKKTGDAIRVVDGQGMTYDVTIREISRHAALCTVSKRHHRLHEPEVDVTLAVGILKNPSRFDFLVEKATELGINAILPLLTDRTIPRQAKRDRWQKISLAAMKQSGRSVLPRVAPLQHLTAVLQDTEPRGLRLLLHTGAGFAPLHRVLAEHRAVSVALAIGPEGGFTDAEVDKAVSKGWIGVGLGSRQLRTETAALAAASMILCSAPLNCDKG